MLSTPHLLWQWFHHVIDKPSFEPDLISISLFIRLRLGTIFNTIIH